MNAGRFLSVFDSRHVVLPVIHVRDRAQAQANADIAHAAGADGVFLINHAIGDAELLELHAEVAARHRRWFVGINCVGLSPRTVFAKLTPAVAGLWVDDAGIDERVSVQIEAKAIAAARRASGWSGLYFGGVGLERREVEDVTATTLAARDYMDVVTTTGAGPGEPAPLAKIRAMRAAYDQALSGWTQAVESIVASEGFADVSAQMLQQYLTLQSSLRNASTTAAAELHLPTLDDFARLSTMVVNVERKVDEVADLTREIAERLAAIESRLGPAESGA